LITIRFRPAEISDLEKLFEWRNDPATRDNSLKKKEISAEEHAEWLSASLISPDRKLYIAETSGDPIGTVRLDRRGSAWELSWTVAPILRGKGYGKAMVKAATSLTSESLITQVKSENLPSLRIAEFAGFRIAEEQDGVVRLELLK